MYECERMRAHASACVRVVHSEFGRVRVPHLTAIIFLLALVLLLVCVYCCVCVGGVGVGGWVAVTSARIRMQASQL